MAPRIVFLRAQDSGELFMFDLEIIKSHISAQFRKVGTENWIMSLFGPIISAEDSVQQNRQKGIDKPNPCKTLLTYRRDIPVYGVSVSTTILGIILDTFNLPHCQNRTRSIAKYHPESQEIVWNELGLALIEFFQIPDDAMDVDESEHQTNKSDRETCEDKLASLQLRSQRFAYFCALANAVADHIREFHPAWENMKNSHLSYTLTAQFISTTAHDVPNYTFCLPVTVNGIMSNVPFVWAYMNLDAEEKECLSLLVDRAFGPNYCTSFFQTLREVRKRNITTEHYPAGPKQLSPKSYAVVTMTLTSENVHLNK